MNDVTVCDAALNEVMDNEMFVRPMATGGSYTGKLRGAIATAATSLSDFIKEPQPMTDFRAVADELCANHNDRYNVLVSKLYADDQPFAHYITMDGLPEAGSPTTVYKIDTTGDLYVFRDNQYCPYNPYAEADEQIQSPRVMIEDPSAFLPHGGTGPLAMVYNIHALRRDLVMKEIMGWSFMDMVPAGMIKASEPLAVQRVIYFRHSHKALHAQMRSHLRVKGSLNKEYMDALNRIGVDVWYTNHEFGFKDGDFTVVFA